MRTLAHLQLLPDGTYFVSVSGDKTIDLFEGKVGARGAADR